MKKIALVLVAAMVLVFTGCEKKETISMPFDVADVNNIEMYCILRRPVAAGAVASGH